MLEAHENNTDLPFGCLLTEIILQTSVGVAGKSKMKIQDPISKQTLMKSNGERIRMMLHSPLLFMLWYLI
jgi:hypothetical protein